MQICSLAVCKCRQGFFTATLPDGQNIGIKHIPATQCGIWVRTSNGGHFASPNYPDSYPPNKECIYILEGI
ncbi:hypothetical protein J1605_000541 [Eschrichtius robustus]|uniref:CUB domain-containing protein n=1 Tax=Eschrichtius robustus TaxID=9764 RepID=A0AB34GTT3_ESCRO|nr:hypothetical protein J1605_000541 [Eschrichtius robustus]